MPSIVLRAVVLTLLLVSAGGRGDTVGGHLDADGYALLAVPRHDLTLLMDTQHKYLSVKEGLSNTCYLLALELSPYPAMKMIVHIYNQGLSGLLRELTVSGEATHGWISNWLGKEHVRFCQNSPILLVAPPLSARESTVDPSKVTQPQPVVG